MHSADTQHVPLDNVASLPQRLRFVYLLAIPEVMAIRISNKINSWGYAAAHYTPSWSGNNLVDIHVTHPEATKENAVKIWQKMMGVSKEETIGVGDSGNDIPIFESVGFRVAVNNATNSLKQLADYIAPFVEDHALKHVIDKFLVATTNI